jgi:predicted DsbA family dithiol-disulfide isomerase
LESAEFARDHGRYDAIHHALFRGFFEQGYDLNDVQVLVEIGESTGLDPEALCAAIEQGCYTERVLQDARLAHDLGVTAVPMLLIRRCDQPLEAAQALSGAQPYDVLHRIVGTLLHERA